jgi:hypothetical protein
MMSILERRKFVRIPCENIINYDLMEGDGSLDTIQTGYVQCKNVSKGGVLFTSFEDFSHVISIRLKLRIEVTEGHNENVDMVAKIVRCEKVRNAPRWNIAACIQYIEEDKKDLFLKWVARIEKPSRQE